MSKWIDFVEGHSNGITKVFLVKEKEGNGHLGMIKWYSPWRKYSFFPNQNTIFETDCLKDIISFITKLMLDRKVAKQNEKLQ